MEAGERVGAESLSMLHIAEIALCSTGFAIDLSEIAMGNALPAIFSSGSQAVGPLALSLLISSVYVGAVLGAPAGGLMASRWGMRATLTGILLWLAVTSGVAAASANVAGLSIARLLSGFALGAYPPLMIAYLAHIAPPRHRARVVLIACGLAYLGPPAAIFGTRWLTPIGPYGIDGWRWPFAIAALLAVFAAAAFRTLPEVRPWQDAGSPMSRNPGRFARPDDVPAHSDGESAAMDALAGRRFHLFRREFRRRLVVLFVLLVLTPFATVAFPALTGPALLARGVSLSNALLYVGLATFGPVIGTLASGLFLDRLSRPFALMMWPSVMIAMVLIFFTAPAPSLAAAAVIGFGIASSIYLPTLVLGGSELFPAAMRPLATSLTWTGNRLGAALAPVLLLPLIHSGRLVIVEIVIASALTVCICAVPLVQWVRGGAPT
jgi:putative MFS transporter